jgi:ribonucleoside-diphosphate reductase alpha chain
MTQNTPVFAQPISEQIWNDKYRFVTDRSGFNSDEIVSDTWNRVAYACAKAHEHDTNLKLKLHQEFLKALSDWKFLPAGRILSGSGTGRTVTLFNCYVMGTIPDSLDGIFDMLKEAALTMQQGGGIGYDFSTLRPKGAPVKGVESFSSGPLTFMDVWDSMCKTIMSAGHRRGAMMATMRCDHPDIEEFIMAKRDPARLRHFNVSVLCTDAFMEAVYNDKPWDLVFDGKTYKTTMARDLWEMILQNTYDYAEPGVIFIDRINKENNLWFLETIAATNPCGEQPLPPYGACLLGSINLPKFVRDPFDNNAQIEWDSLETTVRSATRMLDCVVDTSGFPLEAQEAEAKYKRRQGLGVTGLADLLFMTGHRYGTTSAIELTERIMKNIAIWAYEESIQMAKEWGPAPFIQSIDAREDFCKSGFMKRMPTHIHEGIMKSGIRNSHLLSIAPTGTISMYGGNVSSGVEPIFATSYSRNITNADGSKRQEKVMDYAVWLYNQMGHQEGDEWWHLYMTTAQDLTPRDHILMQAAAQKWVDSSISKTVNCPVDISFEDFQDVYLKAYETGCKGCTTYRPNDVTGSILFVENETKETDTEEDEPLVDEEYDGDLRIMSRPTVTDGSTYKIRWGNDSFYVTFNNVIDPEHDWFMPFEIFINSKNVEHQAWINALTRMVSAVFQRGGDIRFVAEELKQIHDPKGGQWSEGRYHPSLVALIGHKLEEHLMLIGYQASPEQEWLSEGTGEAKELPEPDPDELSNVPDPCPSCGSYNTYTPGGCLTCKDCGHSKCG